MRGIEVHGTEIVISQYVDDTTLRSLPWEGKYGMEWTDTFTVLGINYNVNKMSDITRLQIEKRINDIKNEIIATP